MKTSADLHGALIRGAAVNPWGTRVVSGKLAEALVDQKQDVSVVAVIAIEIEPTCAPAFFVLAAAHTLCSAVVANDIPIVIARVHLPAQHHLLQIVDAENALGFGFCLGQCR